MENKEIKQRVLTDSLLIAYLLIMTWIILFKMQFSFQQFDHLRSINLIPFNESVIVNNKVELSEIYQNILIFVPFGLYVSMLKSNWSFFEKIVPIFSVSLFYEVMQFVLAIGASDITDLIGNTFGGMIGIAVFFLACKLFKTHLRTNTVLNTIALVGTLLVIVLVVFLAVSNF